MDALTTVTTRVIPQDERADPRQIPNAAGGYGFAVGDDARVHHEWSVYALIDPRDDQVRYIGKSTNVDIRVKAHIRERGTTRKIRWIQTLIRDSEKPKVQILETGTGDWEDAETKWIAYYRSLGYDLTNATSGGEGLRDPSPETRALIGAAQRAIRNDPDLWAQRRAIYDSVKWRAAVSSGLLGKKKTPERVAALPQNKKGYPWSDEVRAARRATFLAYAIPAAAARPRSQKQNNHVQALIESNKGKPGWARGRVLSEEERRIRSVATRGRPKSEEHKEKIRQGSLRRWAKARGEGVAP